MDDGEERDSEDQRLPSDRGGGEGGPAETPQQGTLSFLLRQIRNRSDPPSQAPRTFPLARHHETAPQSVHVSLGSSSTPQQMQRLFEVSPSQDEFDVSSQDLQGILRPPSSSSPFPFPPSSSPFPSSSTTAAGAPVPLSPAPQGVGNLPLLSDEEAEQRWQNMQNQRFEPPHVELMVRDMHTGQTEEEGEESGDEGACLMGPEFIPDSAAAAGPSESLMGAQISGPLGAQVSDRAGPSGLSGALISSMRVPHTESSQSSDDTPVQRSGSGASNNAFIVPLSISTRTYTCLSDAVPATSTESDSDTVCNSLVPDGKLHVREGRKEGVVPRPSAFKRRQEAKWALHQAKRLQQTRRSSLSSATAKLSRKESENCVGRADTLSVRQSVEGLSQESSSSSDAPPTTASSGQSSSSSSAQEADTLSSVEPLVCFPAAKRLRKSEKTQGSDATTGSSSSSSGASLYKTMSSVSLASASLVAMGTEQASQPFAFDTQDSSQRTPALPPLPSSPPAQTAGHSGCEEPCVIPNTQPEEASTSSTRGACAAASRGYRKRPYMSTQDMLANQLPRWMEEDQEQLEEERREEGDRKGSPSGGSQAPPTPSPSPPPKKRRTEHLDSDDSQYLNRSPRWQREDREEEEAARERKREENRRNRNKEDSFRAPGLGTKATPSCDDCSGGGSVGNEESHTEDRGASGSSSSLSGDSKGYHPSGQSSSCSSTGNTCGTTLDQEEGKEEEEKEGEGKEGEGEGGPANSHGSCVVDNSLTQSYCADGQQLPNGSSSSHRDEALAAETLDHSATCLASDSFSSQTRVQETLVRVATHGSPGVAEVVRVSETVDMVDDGEDEIGVPKEAPELAKPVPVEPVSEQTFPLSDPESDVPSSLPPRAEGSMKEEGFAAGGGGGPASQLSCWALSLSSSSCGTLQQPSSSNSIGRHPPEAEGTPATAAAGSDASAGILPSSTQQDAFVLQLTPTQHSTQHDRLSQDHHTPAQAVACSQEAASTQQQAVACSQNSVVAVANSLPSQGQGGLHLEPKPPPTECDGRELVTGDRGMESGMGGGGMESGTGGGKDKEESAEEETPSSCSGRCDSESHDPTPPDDAGCGAAGGGGGGRGGGEGRREGEREGGQKGEGDSSPPSEAAANGCEDSVAGGSDGGSQGAVQCPTPECEGCVPVPVVAKETSPLAKGVDDSQSTQTSQLSSGTPFHFHLPSSNDSLLRPRLPPPPPPLPPPVFPLSQQEQLGAIVPSPSLASAGQCAGSSPNTSKGASASSTKRALDPSHLTAVSLFGKCGVPPSTESVVLFKNIDKMDSTETPEETMDTHTEATDGGSVEASVGAAQEESEEEMTRRYYVVEETEPLFPTEEESEDTSAPLCHSAGGEKHEPSSCHEGIVEVLAHPRPVPATPPGSRALLPSDASTPATPSSRSRKASLSLRRRGARSDIKITEKRSELEGPAASPPKAAPSSTLLSGVVGVVDGREKGFVLGVTEEEEGRGRLGCLPDDVEEESQFHVPHISILSDSDVSGSQNSNSMLEMVPISSSKPTTSTSHEQQGQHQGQSLPASLLFASLRSGAALRGSTGSGDDGRAGGGTGNLLGTRMLSDGVQDGSHLPNPFEFDDEAEEDSCSTREPLPVKQAAPSSAAPVAVADSEDPLGREKGERRVGEGEGTRHTGGGAEEVCVAASSQRSASSIMEEEEEEGGGTMGSQPSSQSSDSSLLCCASQPLKALPEDTTPLSSSACPLPPLPPLPCSGAPATVVLPSCKVACASRQLFPEPNSSTASHHHHHSKEPTGGPAASASCVCCNSSFSDSQPFPSSSSSNTSNSRLTPCSASNSGLTPCSASNSGLTPCSASNSGLTPSSTLRGSACVAATPPSSLPPHYTSPCARMSLGALQGLASAVDSSCGEFAVRHVRRVRRVTTIVSTDVVRDGCMVPELSTVETIDEPQQAEESVKIEVLPIHPSHQLQLSQSTSSSSSSPFHYRPGMALGRGSPAPPPAPRGSHGVSSTPSPTVNLHTGQLQRRPGSTTPRRVASHSPAHHQCRAESPSLRPIPIHPESHSSTAPPGPALDSVPGTSRSHSRAESSSDGSARKGEQRNCGDVAYAEGAKVLARWTDGFWYSGTVTRVAGGRLDVLFAADDEELTVTASNIMSLKSVAMGTDTYASKVRKSPQLQGIFSGFVDDSLSRFSLLTGRPPSDAVVVDTSRIALSDSSARECKTCSSTGAKKESTTGTPTCWNKRKCKFSAPTSSKRRRQSRTSSPDSGSELFFNGFTFFLTQQRKGDKCGAPSPPPFDRKRVSCVIEERGGKIRENWNGFKVSRDCFLLSDSYCRTEKYLMALACGVPCVSYEWIHECMKEGEVVSYESHLLPAGFSSERNCVVSWSPRTQGTILDNTTLHITGDEGFKSRWIPVARKAGAKVTSKMPKPGSKVDSGVVVCPSDHLSAAMGGISPEWIVQCLIEGRKMENYQFYLYNSK